MDVRQLFSPDEVIIKVIHRHWVGVLPVLILTVILMLISLFGFYLLGLNGADLSIGLLSLGGLAVMALFALALGLGYIGLRTYRQNQLVLTNRHIYLTVRNSLLNHRLSQFGLEQIEDISAMQNGFFPNFLGYGEVLVETAGERENLAFTLAPHPQQVADLIQEAHHECVNRPRRDNNG